MGLFGKKNKSSENKTNGEHEVAREVTLQSGQSYPISQTVDCLGDSCPRPQLMTKKALSGSASSDVIEVMVDNPTSMEALPPMCAGLNATHLETTSVKNGWNVYIQKN